MIESAIIALREGIEIALILGIVIVYLRKMNRQHLVRSVYSGLAAACVASGSVAYVVRHFAIDQEIIEGYLMLVAAGFVITMIIWMWIAAKRIRGDIQEKVNDILKTSSLWRAHLGIFLFTFMMIAREGIETAVFLQAVSVSEGSWQTLLGTAAGIIAASMFAILFIRGSLRINLPRFLRVTAITLLIFAFQLIVNGVHELYEFGILPANPEAMGILGPVVQNNMFFILAIISVPALMLIFPGRSNEVIIPAGTHRPLQLSAGIAFLCVVFFLGMGEVYSSNPEMDFNSMTLNLPTNGPIEIPLSQVEDGNLHRYSVKDDAVEIRFFVLRTGMGKFATAFDACYACYSYGRYYVRKGDLICSLCDAPSPIAKLRPSADQGEPEGDNSGSMEGNGCAPVYLRSHLDHGKIVVQLGDLRSKRKYFDISEEKK